MKVRRTTRNWFTAELSSRRGLDSRALSFRIGELPATTLVLAEFAGLQNLTLKKLLHFSIEPFPGKADSLPEFSFRMLRFLNDLSARVVLDPRADVVQTTQYGFKSFWLQSFNVEKRERERQSVWDLISGHEFSGNLKGAKGDLLNLYQSMLEHFWFDRATAEKESIAEARIRVLFFFKELPSHRQELKR